MLGVRAGAGLGDRDRRADLAGRDARQPCRALVRVGKARDEEPRRHLPRGEGARQPQQPGFRGNRLLGDRNRPIAVERCARAGQADLEQAGLRHRSERIGQDVVLRDRPPTDQSAQTLPGSNDAAFNQTTRISRHAPLARYCDTAFTMHPACGSRVHFMARFGAWARVRGFVGSRVGKASLNPSPTTAVR